MDREDTQTPRPPSPTDSSTSASTISTYVDAKSEESSDITITRQSTSGTNTKSETEEASLDSSLQESRFTVVDIPDSLEDGRSTATQGPSGHNSDSASAGVGQNGDAGGSAGVALNRVDAGESSSAAGKGVSPPPRTKRNRTSSRIKRLSRQEDSSSSDSALPFPEQGWDDGTPRTGKVIQYKTGDEVERSLTCTAKLADSSMEATKSDWTFRKDFVDDSFVASGRLYLPPKALKSYKATNDNTYVFYVVEGAICAKIHETNYILCQGASFMVPRGNHYSIENISNRPAKIHFAQSREKHAHESEDPLHLTTSSTVADTKIPLARTRPLFLTSKVVILLSFLLEKLIKRLVKYQKVFQKLYVKYAMVVAKNVRSGPKAYLAFFFLGFLMRGIGFRKSFVPTIRVMVAGHSNGPREISV
ncbi:hypothetical protein E1B28_009348 [Marasmius oreades]|uniref:CENP-C homolog n=1 Tax=Marasmius oreades TaxID=181124 RepID=A0A9P7S0A5_9AGAR|nr:uncharacterized protein E1B28_009348 [Marasmius oreades]KAG7093056.1 hypothetical protein E1B28_009348 [Marasmius oreades]